MKQKFMQLLLATVIITAGVSAQEKVAVIKNFAGPEYGLDILHASHAAGLGFERMLISGEVGAMSIKARYFFRHRNDNNKEKFEAGERIFASQLQGMINGYLFIDRALKPSGLFLYAGAGLMYTKRTLIDDTYTMDLSGFAPGVEAGIGTAIPVADKNQIQLKAYLSFYGAVNEKPGANWWDRRNTMLMPGLSLHFGF